MDSKATPNSSFKGPASPSDLQAKGHASDRTSTNGVRKPSKNQNPKSAFELYCLDARPALEENNRDDECDIDVDEELARAWADLPSAEKGEIQTRFEELSKKPDDGDDNDDDEKDKPDKDLVDQTPEKEGKPGGKTDTQDEDVEMTNYDTEDQDGETQMDKDGDD